MWLPSCGNGQQSHGGNGADAGADAGGAGAEAGGSAGISGNGCFGLPACPDEGVRDPASCECRPCEKIDECPEGQTCELDSGQCKSGLECTSHDECGRASACGPEGTCVPNHAGGPCARESNCPVSDHCSLEFCGCTVTRYTVSTQPPEVLIVLDRSDSMNELVDGTSKWDIARQAIGDLVASHEQLVRFGLWAYPGTTLDCSGGVACDAGALLTEPAAEAASSITEALASAETCALGTPTAEALTALEDSSLLESSERSSYVVLITDGKSTCEPPAPAAQALFERQPSVPTFVIGFGDAVDPEELYAIAQAGGTVALSPEPGFHVAQDAAGLGAALLQVAGATLPCSFDLAGTPKPHGSEVLLYFGDEAVTQDSEHEDGWDYDVNTNRVTVYGPACDELSTKQVTEASLVYTCSFEPL